MDVLDRKILYELDKNSRASYSQIAKATRAKQETVRYRINNLFKTGIIQKFLTTINTKKLGYSYYKIYLNLQNVTEEKKNTILSFLQNQSLVASLVELDGGGFDVVFILSVSNQAELEVFFHELYIKYGQFIMKKIVSINLEADFFNRDYLIHAERKIRPSSIYKAEQEFISLDKTDTQICRFLAENARISAVEMGQMLSISPDAVIQRMKKLVTQKIITGYTLVLNNEALHQYGYKIILYLADLSLSPTLMAFAKSNSHIISLVKVLSEWDYEIDLEVQNPYDVKQFIMELSNLVLLRDYFVFHITKIHKFTFFPQ